MKKVSLFIFLFALVFSLKSYCQASNKNLSFCKQFFTAESLLKLSMKYNDNEESFNIFIIEANRAAERTQTLLNEIEPTIKTKLTKQELEDLKASVKFINDRTIQSGLFDQGSLMKISLWFQFAESRLSPIFPKLMK